MSSDALTLGGMVPFSTGDFPGRLAAVFFTQGCPLRCRYCHNPHLRPRASSGALTWAAATAWLLRRQGLLDGVVISGGEPTIQAGLPSALADIRGLGFATGLHSSGANPKRLAEALKLVDWVGLDIKAPFDRYGPITGSAASGARAERALQAVLNSGKAFEIRTTLHTALLSAEDLLRIAETLRASGIRNWVLQVFRATGCEDAELPLVRATDWLDTVLPSLRELVPDIAVR